MNAGDGLAVFAEVCAGTLDTFESKASDELIATIACDVRSLTFHW